MCYYLTSLVDFAACPMGMMQSQKCQSLSLISMILMISINTRKCYDWTSLIRSYIGLHHFFSHSPTPKPMYNTILSLGCVRYNLESCLRTIRSRGSFLYDINLRATATIVLRIRGVQIPIDLVSSATDSYRRSVVLFKPMSVPTSDPKSEFLYQSSSIVHNLQTSP